MSSGGAGSALGDAKSRFQVPTSSSVGCEKPVGVVDVVGVVQDVRDGSGDRHRTSHVKGSLG